MNFRKSWVWLSSAGVVLVVSLLALVPLLAVVKEVEAETGASHDESVLAVALLAGGVGLVAGGLTLLVCARIARSRARRLP